MNGKADSPRTPSVKYGLCAEEAAANPIVLRHFVVAEENRIIDELQMQLTIAQIVELKRAGVV